MTRLPRIAGQRLVRALRRAGFEVVRVKGSHCILGHPDGRRTVVPVHRGEVVGPGLMSRILNDCEISREEFLELLQAG